MTFFDEYDQDYDRDPDDHRLPGVVCGHQTDKAWLIVHTQHARGPRQAWFPKSQCHFEEAAGVIYYPDWLTPDWKPVKQQEHKHGIFGALEGPDDSHLFQQ